MVQLEEGRGGFEDVPGVEDARAAVAGRAGPVPDHELIVESGVVDPAVPVGERGGDYPGDVLLDDPAQPCAGSSRNPVTGTPPARLGASRGWPATGLAPPVSIHWTRSSPDRGAVWTSRPLVRPGESISVGRHRRVPGEVWAEGQATGGFGGAVADRDRAHQVSPATAQAGPADRRTGAFRHSAEGVRRFSVGRRRVPAIALRRRSVGAAAGLFPQVPIVCDQTRTRQPG